MFEIEFRFNKQVKKQKQNKPDAELEKDAQAIKDNAVNRMFDVMQRREAGTFKVKDANTLDELRMFSDQELGACMHVDHKAMDKYHKKGTPPDKEVSMRIGNFTFDIELYPDDVYNFKHNKNMVQTMQVIAMRVLEFLRKDGEAGNTE